MISAKKSEFQVSRDALLWVLLAQAIAIAPLFFQLHLWIPALWMLMLLWRVGIYLGRAGYPGFVLKTVIGCACIAGLVSSYYGSFTLEAAVAILVVGFVLKLIEMRTRKDVLIVLYTCFFALAAQLLFSQSFGSSIYALFSFSLIITALAAIYQHRDMALLARYWQGAKIVLLAIPGMLILFLLLPRLGPIWHVPNAAPKAATGFGDTVAPGDITQLTRSGEIAFRVTFYYHNERDGSLEVAKRDNKAVPVASERYWRALVLDEYDGRAWRKSETDFFSASQGAASHTPADIWGLEYEEDALQYHYDIMLEPHQRRRLFVLPAPLKASARQDRLFFRPDLLLVSETKVLQRKQYRVSSVNAYRFAAQSLDSVVRRRNLTLPPSDNPQTRQLARRWLLEGLSPEQRVDRALLLFQQSFSYTLAPPPLGANAVDDFLFTTQRGFCEHFASSFVFFMRALNIPARVVVGYQGGEFNDQEDFLTVRQSDAHAWAEVWLSEKGWTRIDPTASVVPERIELGLSNAVGQEESKYIGSDSWFTSSNRLLQQLQRAGDALSYRWHRWVLDYSPSGQRDLITRLLGGTAPWRIMLAFFVVAGIVAFMLFMVVWLAELRAGPSYSERWYQRHLKRLAKLGYDRGVGETPLDFARRIAEQRPEWRSDLQTIALIFNAVEYNDQIELNPKLRRAVKNFHAKVR